MSTYCNACNYVCNYVFYIGAMSLYRMGINYLGNSQVPNTATIEYKGCCQPPYDVTHFRYNIIGVKGQRLVSLLPLGSCKYITLR